MILSLKKGILELRFSNVIDTSQYVDSFKKISQNLRQDFSTPTYDFQSMCFKMENAIVQQRCTISPANIVIEYDSSKGIEAFNKLIENVLRETRQCDILQNISRIGYRTIWGKDFDNISTVDKVLKNMFSIEESKLMAFGNSKNMRIGFSLIEGEYNINCNFSSAINKEVKINNNGVIVSEEEKYCMIGDFDIYTEEDCKYSNIYKYIVDFTTNTCEKVNALDGAMGEL